MGWIDSTPEFSGLEDRVKHHLVTLKPADVPADTVLFNPGEAVKGYVIVLKGKVNVFLTGKTGREILLYQVCPGQSCIQSTLGLMGDEDYSAQAVCDGDARVVLIPKQLFLDLIEVSEKFRALVFAAFAGRVQTMMRLVEKVAFQRVECRLAANLLDRMDDANRIVATQQELATAVGSAREVVSRRLESWSKQGWVRTTRGAITVLNKDALLAISLSSV